MLLADRRGTHRPCLTVQVVLEDQYAVTPPLILKLRGIVAMFHGQPGLAGPRQRGQYRLGDPASATERQGLCIMQVRHSAPCMGSDHANSGEEV